MLQWMCVWFSEQFVDLRGYYMVTFFSHFVVFCLWIPEWVCVWFSDYMYFVKLNGFLVIFFYYMVTFLQFCGALWTPEWVNTGVGVCLIWWVLVIWQFARIFCLIFSVICWNLRTLRWWHFSARIFCVFALFVYYMVTMFCNSVLLCLRIIQWVCVWFSA